MHRTLESLLLLLQKLLAASVASDELASIKRDRDSSIQYKVYSSVSGVLILGWLLSYADSFHLNVMDISVLKKFPKSLHIDDGAAIPVLLDLNHKELVINSSTRFLDKLMISIRHKVRIPSKAAAKLHTERKQFVSIPVELESSSDALSDSNFLTEWLLSDVSDAIISLIDNGRSQQSMIADIKCIFWSIYKASELQYLLYASNVTIPFTTPKQLLHLSFRLPGKTSEEVDNAKFSDCLSELLWKWSTPASSTFLSETPTSIDASRAFYLKLAWERALAAAVLIHRCNIAATGNLPAKVVGQETARFLCQFHSSRLMLRSANANATAKERKGNLKAAISPADEEDILFSTQCKILHCYLNRLLLLMNEDVFSSTVSYLSSEVAVAQEILLPYNWSSDVGLAVVSSLLYKIIQIDKGLSINEADGTVSSVYDIIHSTLAENGIDWDLKPVDTNKIPISRGLGLDRSFIVEFMSELGTIDKDNVKGKQLLLKGYFSAFLCWIPAIYIQIDLSRRSYFPRPRSNDQSSDDLCGSQLDINGCKVFLLHLLVFLELELRATSDNDSSHSHHWLARLASNMVKSFLLVKEEVDTIVSTTVLTFDENYQALNDFAESLETLSGHEDDGRHTMYFILNFLQRFNQDSTIAVAAVRVLNICNPIPAHFRSVSWAMVRELYTEHTNFNSSLLDSHDSSQPPGMDELLFYIIHLTSGDELRSAVLEEVSVAGTPPDNFTNLLDLMDSSLRIQAKGKLAADCGLQNFLTTWMYWWSLESTTGRLYGVLQCLMDIFRCFLSDDVSPNGKDEIFQDTEDPRQLSSSYQKSPASEFPSLTLETLSFHLKLALSMLPALFALDKPQLKDSSPYENFFNVSKVATAFYRDFTTVLQEKEEHLWIILETAPFMVKHSKATLEGIHRYIDRAMDWRLNHCVCAAQSGQNDDANDCESSSAIDFGSVEFLREALEFALMVTVSILAYWKEFDVVILQSQRYEYPKSLRRGITSVEQSCATLAASVTTLADALSLELQSIDFPTPSDELFCLSIVLAKELHHVFVGYNCMTSQNWIDLCDVGFQGPQSFRVEEDSRTGVHLTGLMEESVTASGDCFDFSAITTNDGDGWGLYSEDQ